MRDAYEPNRSTRAEAIGRSAGHPVLEWIGWTVLWLAASIALMAAAMRLRPGHLDMYVAPMVAALVIGFARKRWNFVLSPLAIALILAAALQVASVRYDNTRFAEEAGFIILWVMLAVVAAGSLLSAAVGVGLGIAVPRSRPSGRSGASTEDQNVWDPSRGPGAG